MATTNNEKSVTAPARYFEGVGRRKTSVARVRLFASKGKDIEMIVNDKAYKDYFPTVELQSIAENAFHKSSLAGHYRVTAKLNGGGINSQAEALRHGIARALLVIDPELRKILKLEGYLKRDPRAKERRKFGLKKARKAPQWAKR
jgi:small subunit ribosomal protein S9